MKKKKSIKHKLQERSIQPDAKASELVGHWYKNALSIWKHTPIWMLIFWGWVVWVSFWIDQVPAEKLKESESTQKLMDIEFNKMRFEQKFNDGMQIVVEAPRARIDQENKVLKIEKPVLTHIRGDQKTYTASGDEGTISLKLDHSALPSSFERLTINGNAMAKSGATSVTSNTIVFDCSSQIFYGLGRYESDQNGMIMRGENMKFDPVNNIITGNIRLDELNEILSAS